MNAEILEVCAMLLHRDDCRKVGYRQLWIALLNSQRTAYRQRVLDTLSVDISLHELICRMSIDQPIGGSFRKK